MSVECVLTFSGRVACRFDGCGPLGLVLSGHTLERSDEVVHAAFAGPAPADFPATLEGARIERTDEESFRIISGARTWAVSARALHVHREVAAAFYRAVPGAPLRWTQRLFWRMVVVLAATSTGRSLLRTLRRA